MAQYGEQLGDPDQIKIYKGSKLDQDPCLIVFPKSSGYY